MTNRFASFSAGRAEGSFTLVEVMVVLAIIATMILLVRPSLEGVRPRHNLDAAAWRLSNAVRSAR